MNVLTIGGATQDIFLRYEGAPLIELSGERSSGHYIVFGAGEKISLDAVNYHTGGGATNVAVSLSRLGMQTSCFCKIGCDEASKMIMRVLASENIDTTTVVSSPDLCSGTSFVINAQSGERTIFAYRGANTCIKSNEIPYGTIESADALYITSLSGDAANLLPTITAHAQKHNTSVVINPGSSQIKRGIKTLKSALRNVSTFICNSTEAALFIAAETGETVSNEKHLELFHQARVCPAEKTTPTPRLLKAAAESHATLTIESFAQRLFDCGVTTVVVTDGCHGAYAATHDEMIFHRACATHVVDTLGAGDAFGSAFAAYYLRDYSLGDALSAGVINSSSVISHIGAKDGLMTCDALEKKRKTITRNALQRLPITK